MSTLSLNNSKEQRRARVDDARETALAYTVFTATVARYPTALDQLAGSVTAGLIYTALGIANEIGELAEQFDSEAITEQYRHERYRKAWHELGDVQWYIARLCEECRELPTFSSIVASVAERIADVGFREARLSGYDLQSGLCLHAGRVLGVVKKMMRDGASWDANKRADKMLELRDAVFNLVLLSYEFAERTAPLVDLPGGYNKLLGDNTDKLSGRKERGTLQGDGDVR